MIWILSYEGMLQMNCFKVIIDNMFDCQKNFRVDGHKLFPQEWHIPIPHTRSNRVQHRGQSLPIGQGHYLEVKDQITDTSHIMQQTEYRWC